MMKTYLPLFLGVLLILTSCSLAACGSANPTAPASSAAEPSRQMSDAEIIDTVVQNFLPVAKVKIAASFNPP